jgi:hypothetical protein
MPQRAPLAKARRSPLELAYVALLLALIPLAIDAMASHRSQGFGDQLVTTIHAHPEVKAPVANWFAQAKANPETADLEQLFAVLPDHEVDGAMLPRDSYLHFGLALASAIAFSACSCCSFPRPR